MSILLDQILEQAANGSPATVAFSAESVTVLLFASKFLEERFNWLDRAEDPLDEVTDADWDAIEKLVANAYYELMTPLLGMIFPVSLATLPNNMLLCDGSTYAREDYPDLYAVIDSAFIVDADTFIVPDLRSRIPLGAGEGSGLSNYTVNQTGGEEAHQLTTAELASHNHALFEVDLVALTGEEPVLIPFITSGARATDYEGGDEPHNNIQPFVALNYAMVAF